jgi:branched-chain amino acid transport system ATP-binding protein
MSVLAARRLSAGYEGAAVVRDLDLSVGAGEVVALLGPNGAGKTTTLLTLAGELTPVSGIVELHGSPTREPMHRRVRRGLAMITDERSVIMSLSVKDNLRLRGGSVDDALAHFPELEPHLGRRVGLLSGGQQQMVAMARALASKPSVLLADELSLGLAPLIVTRLLDAVSAAARERGMGCLLVEQHVSQALRVADRVCVLGHGRVVLEGSADEVRTQSELLAQAYLSEVPIDKHTRRTSAVRKEVQPETPQ